MFLIIICYPVSYFWYWWPMKSLIGMADPIHHLIIFAMWVMIWMKERSNIYAFAISMAGPHGFVKIIHMYLRTADVWICWFARFAFVKPSCLHLQTTDFNASFGAALDFSQNNFCISQVQSSSFSDRWYPHLTEFVLLLHCSSIRSEFTRPTHFHSALPTEWWIDRVPDWFPDTGGKKKGWSSVGNVQGSTPIWTNPQFRPSGGSSKSVNSLCMYSETLIIDIDLPVMIISLFNWCPKV